MAKKISQLTQATEVKSDDVTVIVQDGETKKLPLNMMVTKKDIENKKIAGLAKLDEIETTYENDTYTPTITVKNKSSVKTGEGDGVDYSANVMDGHAKSAILSGSTKYQIGEFIQDVFVPVQQFKSGYYLGISDGTLIKGENNHKYCEEYIPLPTGVTSITSKGSNHWKKLCCYDSNKNFISGVNGTDGLEDLTFNIPSNAKYFRYSTNTAQGENEYINVVSNTGLLLASSNYNIPCELIRCKMPVLTTTGKNLFDAEADILTYGAINYVQNAQYLILNNDNTRVTLKQNNLIKVKPNSTLTLSCDSRFKVVIQEYDENDIRTMASDKGWQTNGYHTLTVGANTKKVNIYFAKQGSNSNANITSEEFKILKNSIQFEENSTATSYEPYKSNILTVNEDVELRGIGEVQDALDCLTGKVTERVAEIVIDGSNDENWSFNKSLGDGSYNQFTASKAVNAKNVTKQTVLCDKLSFSIFSQT
jgi:hypothetical protein